MNLLFHRFRGLSLLLVIFLPQLAPAQSRTDCNVVNSRILKQAVHYCVQLPPDYDTKASPPRRYPVLYLLHGFSDDASGWISVGRAKVLKPSRCKERRNNLRHAAGVPAERIGDPGGPSRRQGWPD